MLNLIFWKFEHFCFLSFFNQTHQVVITDEGTKVVLCRRSLAMYFVGCVVPVSCVAGSCVCASLGLLLARGQSALKVTAVSGGGGAQILTLQFSICISKWVPALLCPHPFPLEKKKKRQEENFYVKGNLPFAGSLGLKWPSLFFFYFLTWLPQLII